MNPIILITGTGKGIGKSLAEKFLKKGFNVFGYSRENKIKHKNFTFIKINLNDLKLVKKLRFPTTENEIILINNAATIGYIAPLNKKNNEDIINEYNLNLITPSLLSCSLIKHYPKNKKLIINISSGAAQNPIASWSTYCAAKSGLDMFTNVIAKEKHDNLKILGVHPGIIDTNMQKEIRKAKLSNFPMLDKFIDYYKQNKLENPDDIAKKIYYITENREKFTENILFLRNIDLK